MGTQDDVTVKISADVSGLQAGSKAAAQAISDLRSPTQELRNELGQFGDLTARQVGSVVNLFNRLGEAAGISLGPIGILSVELVRASQHFTEFAGAAGAFRAIGATLIEALVNPLTISLGVLTAAAFGAKFLYDTITGPDAKAVEDELKKIGDLIKTIGDRWKVAGEAAKVALAESDAALQRQIFSSLREAERVIDQQMRQQGRNLGNVLADIISEQADTGASRATLDMLRNLSVDLAEGKLDVIAFRDALDALGLEKRSDTKLNSLIDNAEKITETWTAAARAIKALKTEAETLGVSPSVGTLVPKVPGFTDEDIAAAKKKLTAELKTIEAPQIKELNDALRNHQRAVESVQREWEGFFDTIVKGLDRSIAGLIRGTMTWKQAFLSILGTLWDEFVRVVEQMVVKWAAGEAMKLAVSRTSVAAQTATIAAGEAAQTGLVGLHIIKQIIGSAQGVFAGIFSFLSPLMGPAAAIPAGAGSALVAASAAAVPLATGAWEIPGQMLALLHQGEAVLPQPFAAAFRENGGGGMGGGEVHFHLSAIDTRSGADFLRQHAGEIAKAIQGETRKFSRSLKPAWGAR